MLLLVTVAVFALLFVAFRYIYDERPVEKRPHQRNDSEALFRPFSPLPCYIENAVVRDFHSFTCFFRVIRLSHPVVKREAVIFAW